MKYIVLVALLGKNQAAKFISLGEDGDESSTFNFDE